MSRAPAEGSARRAWYAPRDPVMADARPEPFASLSAGENTTPRKHLASGLAKQGEAYSTLSEPWRETLAVIDDLEDAFAPALDAEIEAARPRLAPEPAPEAQL